MEDTEQEQESAKRRVLLQNRPSDSQGWDPVRSSGAGMAQHDSPPGGTDDQAIRANRDHSLNVGKVRPWGLTRSKGVSACWPRAPSALEQQVPPRRGSGQQTRATTTTSSCMTRGVSLACRGLSCGFPKAVPALFVLVQNPASSGPGETSRRP